MKSFIFLLIQQVKKMFFFITTNFNRNICSWSTILQGNVLIGEGSYIDNDSEFYAKEKGSRIVIGNNTYIGKRALVSVLENNSLIIGDKVGINNNVVLFGDIKIGSYSKVAFNIYISSGRHFIDRHPAWLINDQDMDVYRSPDLVKEFSRPVEIHEDVWIGNGVVVMSGVTIGRGAVVGSNAVVTENVFPYTIVGGIPAEFIKTRLEFIPPNYISSFREDHLPYFYEGFYHEREAREIYGEGMLAKEKSSIVVARKGSLLNLKLGGLKGFRKNKIIIYLDGKELKTLILENDKMETYQIEFQSNEESCCKVPYLKFDMFAQSFSLTPNKNLKYSFLLLEASVK